ncbi:MAG: hypothetical protein H6R41_294 [Deltaproteobacteria bacterium]|nr:hypothetical protein [Deltaproteobacteria bacterium]MBS1243757.1 hypothetical protein [Deltaproteobacteria bacterium]
MSGIRVASGHLFFFYAYDAGFEIALEEARTLCEASDSPGIAGLRPAPAHLQYRPRPLTVSAGAVPIAVSGKTYRLDAIVKIFDFGALSVTLTLPLEDLSLDEYAEIALSLASESRMEKSARDAARRLFERILPAVSRAMFADLVEEYCVWHVGGFSPVLSGTEALARLPREIARLLTLERGELSEAAVAEIVRTPIRYFDNDLFLAEWNAAFVYDPKFKDTAEVLEFLNIQVLELRFFDRLLHEAIEGVSEELLPRRRLFHILHDPYEVPMRKLSGIRTDVSLIRERIYNALKLVGDAYLARVYEEARRKVGAEKHEGTVRDQLATLTDIYTVLNNQAQAAREETLELIIILLIAIEIVMGLLRW